MTRSTPFFLSLFLAAAAFAQTDSSVYVNHPYRVDRGLPFAFELIYRNVSTVTLTAEGIERFTRAPEQCTVSGATATCTVEVADEFRRLSFETVAPDADNFEVTFTASSGEMKHVSSTKTFFRTILVTNTNDSGSGSLRAAIGEANASCAEGLLDALCKIGFRLDGDGQWFTIRPETPLPAITASAVMIDGALQTRRDDTNPLGPEIELSGEKLRDAGNGLTFLGPCGGSVTGLAINGFPDNGLYLGGPECAGQIGVTPRAVQSCFVGTDPTGTQAVPNLRGIWIALEGQDSYAPAWISNSVISGNRRSGIWVANGRETRIFRNVIGLNAAATAPLGNGASGVFIETGGSGTDLTDNHLSFNGHYGLALARGTVHVMATYNSFQGNGNLAIDYGLDGVTTSIPDPDDMSLQAPVILSARYDAVSNTTIVEGTADLRSSRGFRAVYLTLFANDAPDDSGFGEGQYLLGRADPDRDSGRFTFVYQGRTPGPWIAATATSYQISGFARDPRASASGGGYSTATTEFSRTVEVSQ